VDQEVQTPLLTERDVIEALGGGSAVARKLGVLRTAVSSWIMGNKGIPYRQHEPLVQLANELRVPGITHELLFSMRKAREEPLHK
jgi:hypothetical protein